jgi:hypothetical protein
MAGFQ